MDQYSEYQAQGVNPQERALDWDDTIEYDGDEYITLIPGDYDFVVEGLERAYFEGSARMPACKQVNLRIRIDSPQGPTYIKHQLFLHTRTAWTISAFFASIGQIKKGQRASMDWQKVPGSTGRCKVTNEEYNGNTYNKIRKFYPKEEVVPQSSYTPGNF